MSNPSVDAFLAGGCNRATKVGLDMRGQDGPSFLIPAYVGEYMGFKGREKDSFSSQHVGQVDLVCFDYSLRALQNKTSLTRI